MASEAIGRGLGALIERLAGPQGATGQPEPAPKAAETPADRVDRRIYGIVVHGIGDQKPGSTLKHVVNEFLPLVHLFDPHAGIDAKPDDDPGTAEVRIRFTEDGKRSELYFREAWWARAFEPPPLGAILTSIPKLLLNLAKQRKESASSLASRFIWLLFMVVRLLLSDVVAVAISLVAIPLALVAGLLAIVPPIRALPASVGAGHRWLSRRAVRGEQAVVEIAVMLAAPLLFLFLIVPLRFLSTVIPTDSLPGTLVTLQKMVVSIITNDLGDMWTYLRKPWEASQIRTRFETRFREVVGEIQADKAQIDALVIIGHSMGTVVAFEALTGHRISELIESNFGGESKPKLLFVSVGSALNLAWDVSDIEDRGRFFRAVSPALEWLNVWASSDPVPRGDLRIPGVVEAMPARYDSLAVVNQMDMFSDHTSYWNNAEQVMAPILDRATLGRHHELLQLDRRARENRVSVLAACKAIAWLAAPIVVAMFAALHGGDWAVSLVPSLLHGNGVEQKWWYDYLLKPAIWAIAAGVIAALFYTVVIKIAWDTWDGWVKYRPAR